MYVAGVVRRLSEVPDVIAPPTAVTTALQTLAVDMHKALFCVPEEYVPNMILLHPPAAHSILLAHSNVKYCLRTALEQRVHYWCGAQGAMYVRRAWRNGVACDREVHPPLCSSQCLGVVTLCWLGCWHGLCCAVHRADASLGD